MRTPFTLTLMLTALIASAEEPPSIGRPGAHTHRMINNAAFREYQGRLADRRAYARANKGRITARISHATFRSVPYNPMNPMGTGLIAPPRIPLRTGYDLERRWAEYISRLSPSVGVPKL